MHTALNAYVLSLANMYVSENLDDEQAAKLIYIQQQTNQEVAEIIGQALELYYQEIYSLE